MKVLFHLGHPAHFHLFKIVIKSLKEKGHIIHILIKKKDVLENLLKGSGFQYYNILPSGRKDSFFSIAMGLLKQDFKMLKFCWKKEIDLLIGTSASISHIGKILGIPSLVVGEDDVAVVPFLAKLAYPLATAIVSPDVCDNGKWNSKSIKYNGYHELAYLHPNHFKPQRKIVENYFDTTTPFFIIRFAKLGAHHDVGIRGINDNIALKLINILKPYGNIFITSERVLNGQLEKYRLSINPIDIHHVLFFASLYIGDSQTMAAETGVLGTPFIRFNDFVNRIGYLNDLEKVYKLGYGILPNDVNRLYEVTKGLLTMENRVEVYKQRREEMLINKIDVSIFLEDLILKYNNK